MEKQRPPTQTQTQFESNIIIILIKKEIISWTTTTLF